MLVSADSVGDRGAMYLVLQVVVAIRFMDCREGMECLPLTCCPMFAVPRNIFDDELRGGAAGLEMQSFKPSGAPNSVSCTCYRS